MYNQYIPDNECYTPVEPIPAKRESGHSPRNPEVPMQDIHPVSFVHELLGNEQKLHKLLRDKLGVSQNGLWKQWKESGIDTGDILLLLILLLLLKQQEDYDVLLALGAVMLLDGKEKKKETQGDD